MKQKKRVFTVKEDGKDITLDALLPEPKVRREGEKLYNKMFAENVKSGTLVRASIEKVMREQGLWDDNREGEFKRLRKALDEGEKKLARGKMRLSEARAIALGMVDDRQSLMDLLAERNRLDLHTAEAQAENMRFSFLVASCIFYGKGSEKFGQPYFKDLDDYLARGDDEQSIEAATQMGKLLYGLDDDHMKKRPEVAWLLKQKMVDDKLQLVNRGGKPVDRQGRLVDEKGRLINPLGQLVDEEGTVVNEDGTYKIESEEYEDDMGWFEGENNFPVNTSQTVSDPSLASV